MAVAEEAFASGLAAALALRNVELADPRISPERGSYVLHHGYPTARAIVFLHGITSSPVQFRQLAELFHANGFNVFAPRMPRHGFANPLSTDHARLTQRELMAYTAQAVEIGHTFGLHLTVAGLSVSGALAAWAFQNRPEVDLAVPIAPAFAPPGVPIQAVPLLARGARVLPNVFVWWDPRLGARLRSPAGYPRFSSHAMAECFQLAHGVYRAAAATPPAGRALLAVTNPRDMAVSNRATRKVIERWQQHSSAQIRAYEFARDLGPLHDVIGPYQPMARTEYVYPILLDLIQSASA